MNCGNKKVLVTGANGYIGRQICTELIKNNYDVHALVYPDIVDDFDNVTQYPLNLMDRDAVTTFFRENSFEKIIHLAWYVGPKCQISPINFDWLEASLHLIKTFWENGGKTVLVSGSMSEYDFSYGWCSEYKTPLDSPSLYGQAKAALYQVLEKFCKFHDLEFKWARIFNIYGLNEKKTRLIPYVINAMINDEDVNVSHCNQIQNYLHVTDVARAIVMFLGSDVQGAVNIASDEPIKLKTMIEFCKKELKYNKEINYGAINASFEQLFLSGDNKRLKTEIGWEQSIKIEDGLKDTIKWWENNG